ncbi:MAG TPA: hypothetical protein VF046_07765 [Gemmatimonadales bacterium]
MTLDAAGARQHLEALPHGHDSKEIAMVPLGALVFPIVLSAVLVFVLSSVIHMLLSYHHRDYAPLPNEDAVRAALRSGKPAPGQYVIPYCEPKQMGSPENIQKQTEGPVAVLNLKAAGPFRMGPSLLQWFVFALVVSAFLAYLAGRALPAGTPYLEVFRLVGTAGFLAYAAGQIPAAIWMGKPWSVAWKEVFDGLLYGLVTAGAFGWLWPR